MDPFDGDIEGHDIMDSVKDWVFFAVASGVI